MDRMEAPGNWLLGLPEKTGASVPVFGDADRKWLRRQATGLFAAALLLLLVFENSRLDLTLSALAFDAETGHFPWQRHWFFNDVMHHGLKTAAFFLRCRRCSSPCSAGGGASTGCRHAMPGWPFSGCC